MTLRRNKPVRALIATLSLLLAAFAVLPPQGVCLRELLSQSQCCLDVPESAATPEPAPPACCAAHAARPQPDRKSPEGSPSPDGGLCLVTSAEPYLAPGSTSDGHADELVATEAPPSFAPLADSFEQSGGERLCAQASASTAPPTSRALRRGSCVLRI